MSGKCHKDNWTSAIQAIIDLDSLKRASKKYNSTITEYLGSLFIYSIHQEFQLKYPDVPIYLIFGQPYYRLRVGDFRTRLEAEKAFQTLSQDYKKAFITSDRIQLPYNVFCDPLLEDENVDDDLDSIKNDTIVKMDISVDTTNIN